MGRSHKMHYGEGKWLRNVDWGHEGRNFSEEIDVHETAVWKGC